MKRGGDNEVTCFYLEKDKKRALRLLGAKRDPQVALSGMLREAVDEKLRRDTSFFGKNAQDNTHSAQGD